MAANLPKSKLLEEEALGEEQEIAEHKVELNF